MSNEVEIRSDRLDRIARKYAWQADLERNAALVQEHIPAIIKQVASIAQQCADPKLRLEASRDMLKLKEVFREQQEKIDAQFYKGDLEALERLARLPQGEQHQAALHMFAQGQISTDDLDAIEKLINAGARAQIAALEAEAE